MSDETPELVYNIIHEIQKEGDISEEIASACKEKFIRVHELLMQTIEKEKKLVEESRLLKQQLSQEVQKLEQAQNNQKTNEDTVKELMDTLNVVKREIETVEEREAVLR
jgi:leucyl-tRNA synthetase